MCWFSSQLKRDSVVTYNNEPSIQVFAQCFNLDIVRHAYQALNIINTELQNFTDIHRSLLEIEKFAKDNKFMDNERTLIGIKAMYERYNTFKIEIIDMLHLFINFHSNIRCI
ncbi:hypothetical protein THOM_1093 [Trachipleistophora hominis]|uniref:Uncharacterized protein n=1 Tax=Trachipleistophora hominis TaxID=72359 RepID=L7JWT5_TRAHO|nr:hypothetical protein THOM_1093 [Trachipleistophora hominis]